MNTEVRRQSQPNLVYHSRLIDIHTDNLQQIDLLIIVIHHRFELIHATDAMFSFDLSFDDIVHAVIPDIVPASVPAMSIMMLFAVEIVI